MTLIIIQNIILAAITIWCIWVIIVNARKIWRNEE